MEKAMLFIIIAFGLSANSNPADYKYFIVDELKNWTEAQTYCRQMHTDLATIANQEDVKTLNDMAASLSTSLAWIGLYDDVNSWRWSRSDSDFCQHEEEFRNWEAGKPDNYGGWENCGEMNFNGFWNDESCSKTQNAICLQVNGSTASFFHLKTNLNWTEAQSYCREHYTDLANVRNLAENKEANNIIQKETVWIGMFRDSWKWVDANNSTFRYWNKGNGEPNNKEKEECAAADFVNSGLWEDWNCNEKKAFICHSELCGNSSHPGHKYFFVGELKNWTEAQNHCRDHYSNLAVIENMEDVRTLNNMAASLNFRSRAWIGLYDDVNSWRWSVSESNLNRDDENKFTNWDASEPSNYRGKESCVEMYSSGVWNDEDCSIMQGSVCSDVKGADVTLVYIDNNMNWTQAQSYCRNNHTDLARARDLTENRKIQTLVPAGKSVWIGLYRPFWMWVDGSKSSFKNWGTGEPNGSKENCALAYLGNSGRWEDWSCNEQMTFICSSVVCGNSSLPTREYIIVDELKTWTEARRYCRENHTDLASIENMEDVRMLNDLAASMGKTSRAWIGLYDDLNNWRWSMSNFHQHEENQFRNWAAGEPNNQYGKENCGALKTDGSWCDVPCSQTLTTVCFNVSGMIPTFYHIKNKMNWNEAQSYCREHYTDLASVRNMSDSKVIQDLITKPVWIGLYRDFWKWVDGRNSSYRYWNSLEPNNGKEECALANFGNSGKWEAGSCGEKKAFACNAVLQSKHQVKLKLVSASSLPVNNATILEDLLKKLKQKLKDNGVKGDIKLSWKEQSDGKILQKEKEKD